MSEETDISREQKTIAPRKIFERMITEEAYSPYNDGKNRPMVELLMMMRDEEGHLEMGWVDMHIEASPETDRSELAVALHDAVSKAFREIDGFEIHGISEGSSGVFYSDPEEDYSSD